MKIKSFLPSKIIACMECFGLYVTLVYLFVELKPEKHEAVIYLCFLYGVICLVQIPAHLTTHSAKS